MTTNDMWDEIDAAMNQVYWRPGDIDVGAAAAHWGNLSISATRLRMKRLAKEYPDKWEFLNVYIPHDHRTVGVLRPVKH